MADRFREEDYLMLSGIQHFVFCPRQWALIHIEQQWSENIHTVDGNIFHERAHDKGLSETRGNVITVRSMPVSSAVLGISGECDVVEFKRDENGIELYGREGRYRPYPIEYKKGKPKAGEEDVLQLTVQAMCLEEMLCCTINTGFLYYGEIRRRVKVDITDDLKNTAAENIKTMHSYFERKHTPNVKKSKKCSGCSLNEICVTKRNSFKTVGEYMKKYIEDDI